MEIELEIGREARYLPALVKTSIIRPVMYSIFFMMMIIVLSAETIRENGENMVL